MIIKNPLIIKKAKLQAKIATPTTSSQTIVADSGYDGLSEVQVEAVTSSIDSNITASNIKKDVTILGVTGTLESGGGTSKLPQVVDRSVTELTADDLAGVTSIGKSAFAYCNKLTSVTIPDSVKSIGYQAFYNCTTLTSVTIGSGVTSIGDYALAYSGLKNVIIPNSVTDLGIYSFSNCHNLITINLPNNLITIPDYIFYTCIKLASITIPNSVTSIGVSAFSSCIGLTSITIPDSVTKIGQYAFENCINLTEMTILATTPPTLAGTNAISSATTKIYIPAGTLEAYQTATNWSSFASKFVELSA